MDAPPEWRDLIERLLTGETRVLVSYGEVALSTVFDRAQDHYLLMAVGCDGHKRVHAPLIHVDILDGKFWIQGFQGAFSPLRLASRSWAVDT